MSHRSRIVVLADSDSYVKWGAALAGTLGPEWDRELLVVDTPLVVSDSQLAASLVGTGVATGKRVMPREIAGLLAANPPDAVLVAAPGPIGMALIRIVARLTPRPVIVSGLPGISIPVTRKALQFRRQADLMIVHSRREVREFGELTRQRGWENRLALASLPFASDAPAHGGDLVFASQAIVPAGRPERRRIAVALRAAALADPHRRVVVKVRTVSGERQTHPEEAAIPDLIAELGPVPQNLVVATGSMSAALQTAAGLVSVSSTSLIEAVARKIPVIAIDDFGVTAQLINPVFEGSGMFGSLADLVAWRFWHPDPAWLADNYFHGSGNDDWMPQLDALIAERRAGRLPARGPARAPGGALREAWDRKRAFGPSDRTIGGLVALVVGVPARALVRVRRRLQARLSSRRSLSAPTG